jgi:hypothetical protein
MFYLNSIIYYQRQQTSRTNLTLCENYSLLYRFDITYMDVSTYGILIICSQI